MHIFIWFIRLFLVLLKLAAKTDNKNKRNFHVLQVGGAWVYIVIFLTWIFVFNDLTWDLKRSDMLIPIQRNNDILWNLTKQFWWWEVWILKWSFEIFRFNFFCREESGFYHVVKFHTYRYSLEIVLSWAKKSIQNEKTFISSYNLKFTLFSKTVWAPSLRFSIKRSWDAVLQARTFLLEINARFILK